MPMGNDAPCRGKRITRTSSAKYLPPNWAPKPLCWADSSSCASSSRSRNARPCTLPEVGRLSRYFVDANFTALRFASADVPPITNTKW